MIKVIALFLSLIILFVTQYQFSILHPGGNDSLPRWLGTKYWIEYGLSPYSEKVSQEAQLHIFGRLAHTWEDQQYFVYPFYVVLFYLPIIWLPFEAGRALGMLAIEAALAVTVFLSARMFKWSPKNGLLGLTLGFSIFFYNGFRTIILWQPAGIVAGLIAVSLWIFKEKRDFLAGICLALATIKPQMVIVIVPFLALWALYNRRWKFIAGLSGTMLVLS
ncbi:MAG TPA: glycosyltransferase family 87 protein [Anaerolineaceae bacterium]